MYVNNLLVPKEAQYVYNWYPLGYQYQKNIKYKISLYSKINKK